MELRHLRYFLAVAETLNFSRAAADLHMAQPPLSQQIRALETELGVQLFDRDQRPLRLTAAGQAFLPAVQTVMAQVDQAVRIVQQAHRGEVGQLVIGFNSAAMQAFLPAVLQSFRCQRPAVNLSLCELDSQLQLQQLDQGLLDCGFLHMPPEDRQRFQVWPVCQEPLMVALSAQHPLAGQGAIALTALAQETFILPPHQMGQRFHHQVLSLCAAAGFTPAAIQAARFLQTVLGLVAGGMGIALVPASMHHLQRTGVVYQDLEPTFTLETVMAWRSDAVSPALKTFLKLVQDQTVAGQQSVSSPMVK